MTRKKVTLAYISNDSERKASYKKRKKGLIKKISELSTLCGVEACAIIYSQYDPEPEVWPSQIEAQAILARFRKLSEMDQCRKMVNQESFMRQRIKKAADQLRRLQKENKYRQLECYMFQIIAGNQTLDDSHLSDAAEMNWVINETLRNIQAKRDALMAESRHRQDLLHLPSVEVSPLSQFSSVPRPSTDMPLESFPWNMVQSPTGKDASGLEGGDFGWNPGMDQLYPYIYNQSNSDQQESHGNNSNNFNDSNNASKFNNFFNYFNN